MRVHIFGGGTHFHVRPHLALSAPAYGTTARHLAELCAQFWGNQNVELHLTKMAGGNVLDTNADISRAISRLLSESETRVIFMSAAMCDFEGYPIWKSGQTEIHHFSGKNLPRLKSALPNSAETADERYANGISLVSAEKVIRQIRKDRKDVFLVGFKTTTGATPDEQFFDGLALLKQSSCNLVLANDLHTRMNMVITPEQARYGVTTDRNAVLETLVHMTWHRSQLHFTRSTVKEGETAAFTKAPTTLRDVVKHCIERGAYRPFLGKTVGHFAAKLDNNLFLTSIRSSDFNKIDETGMVIVETKGDNEVIAHGAKPSVGGQSQRIIFADHPDTDSIVHFHCQLRSGSEVPVRSQREFECGSHECGKNTSDGLKKFGNLYAVMLDRHGPNIVFNSKTTSPKEVIDFIEANFDLSRQTSELS